MTTILIVDDHEMVRAGTRMLLESVPYITVVGEASTGEQALELARELKPDIIIMDVTMPGMNGIEATSLIKSELPNTNILALTIHEGHDYFFQMLQAGASGYVPKRAAPEILIRAIQQVSEGQIYLEPKIAKMLITDYVKRVEEGDEADNYDGLSNREQEVLAHIAQDYTNREIAELLSISIKTVDRHRENIMAKLNFHTRTELVKYAIRKGLVKL